MTFSEFMQFELPFETKFDHALPRGNGSFFSEVQMKHVIVTPLILHNRYRLQQISLLLVSPAHAFRHICKRRARVSLNVSKTSL
jgi:hypothetical protein